LRSLLQPGLSPSTAQGPECIQGSDKPNEIAWNVLPVPAEGNASRE